MTEEIQHIDQKFLDKQSRTIGTYGLETMVKLISFKVLIVGCGGVGIEIAKNLALAGVHTISLYDPRNATLADMGVNFSISDAVIKAKKTMAQASCSYIAELNPNTQVRVLSELTEKIVEKHTVLIITSAFIDLSLTTLDRWNIFCHNHNPVISFILALQVGAVGSVFVDHGPRFTVKDVDGRPALQKSISEIVTRKDPNGESYSRIRFETPEGQTPGALRDYTRFKFSELQGLTKPDGSGLNNCIVDGVVCPDDPKDTVRVYPSFESQGYSAYQTGGFIHEIKQIIPLSFRLLRECLSSPGAFVPVGPMMDNTEESRMHLFIHALLRFADTHNGFLPTLHNMEDAEEVVRLAQVCLRENAAMPRPREKAAPQKTEKAWFPPRVPPPPPPCPLVVDAIDEDSIRKEALIASVELQPLAAFIGAVVGQEVVKITGKYAPIHQWFHFSVEGVLPESPDYRKPDFAIRNSRYDKIISIFGSAFQEKLANLKVFMVGCGALGCENIKNFALCGITCGKHGSLVVTDNDRIELSNLSRQFLFRDENVGQFKSVAASERMKQINPESHVNARQDFVGATTEHLFPDTFWQQIDVVVNALDNMEARLYVDQQCVRFHKVLLEAGTMGTGGNVDIIVPGQTSSYADGGAADQTGGVPMCTLRNFPYIYDHCIEWARALFDDLFVSPMQSANQIITNPKTFIARITEEVRGAQSEGEKRSLIEKNLTLLKSLKHTLDILSRGVNMHTCVHIAFSTMLRLFRDRIYDLQKCFPLDARKKNGELFWYGHRKYPKALVLNPHTLFSTPDVVDFLIATANLYACMFGIHPPKPVARFNDEHNRWMKEYRTVEWLQSVGSHEHLPEYVPGTVEGLDEDVAGDAVIGGESTSVAQEEVELYALLEEVAALARICSNCKAEPLEFEKDDDDNFQIDFITAASNLRAENYYIPTQDRMKVKMVAGKIIPAIATATSAVTGLALIELFKVLQKKNVSTLRNGMLDVGTNNYVLFERDAPVKYRTMITTTYMPEQDYTYKKKIIRVPAVFTKYDFIKIDVTPATTTLEFIKELCKYLNSTLPPDANFEYEVDGIGVGKGLTWNGRLTHPNTNTSLMEAIERQKIIEAGGALPRPFWENRIYFFDLSVSVSVDDGDDTVNEVEVETATICLCIKS